MAVTDFGASEFNVKGLLAMAHAAIAHRDTKVRTGALGVLGGLYAQLGPAFKSQALPESLSAPAAKQIVEALDKIQFDASAVAKATPKRKAKGALAAASTPAVVERVDIASLFPGGTHHWVCVCMCV